MHEGGVGAVLKQAADEVGQKVLVSADRSIDAHLPLASRRRIEWPAHAVQALEFEVGPFCLIKHQFDAGEGVRVVGCKLWID